jgi:hypothetical protein
MKKEINKIRINKEEIKVKGGSKGGRGNGNALIHLASWIVLQHRLLSVSVLKVRQVRK